MKNNVPPHAGVKQYCFTLIELLVVIAVIAVLAAMLFPALGRARDSAKLAGCVSNMKNMSTAYMMYVERYDQYVVPDTAPIDDSRLSYIHQVHAKVRHGKWHALLLFMTGEEKTIKGHLHHYWRNPKWLKCPGVLFGHTELYKNANYQLTYPQSLTPTQAEYTASGADAFIPYRRALRKIYRFRKPGDTVLIYEGGRPGHVYNQAYIPGTGAYSAQFGGKRSAHHWGVWTGSGVAASFDSAFSTLVTGIETFGESYTNSGAPNPVPARTYYRGMAKDFLKGRHGRTNAGLFYDGHVQTASSTEWGRHYYILFKNGTGSGWFWTPQF